MAKFSLEQIKALVSNAVTAAKLSNSTFNVTRDNIVALVDKIGKIVTVDTIYTIDKLNRFDGEYLSYGKIIEEWSQDLILPTDYDSDGAGALSPADPTYRPNFYSYTIGRKKIKESIRNNNIERAVHNAEQFNSIVSMQIKRLADSMAQYRYQVKREMVAKLIGIAEGLMDASTATTFSASTAYPTVNTVLKNASNVVGLLVKPYAANAAADWAAAVAGGWIIPLALTEVVATPTDTTTGEDFIKAVKKDAEIAQDVSEGHSLNANTLGATEGLVLLIKQGIVPSLEVDTLAGAFHDEKLALPGEIIVVKDFGSYSGNAYAVLMDGRGMRLHNTYRATRENFNGDGDFLNLFEHTEDTAYISRNVFVKVYESA